MVVEYLCCMSIIGIPIWIIRKQGKQREQIHIGFEHMANQLRFRFNQHHNWNGTVMTGSIGDYRCSVSFEMHTSHSAGGGSSKHHKTVWKVSLMKPMNMGLDITPHFWGDGLLLRKQQDIETGYSEFDKAFRIKGYDESEVRAFLTPNRMQALLRFNMSRPPSQYVRVTDAEVSVSLPTISPDIQMAMDTLTDAVRFTEDVEFG